MRKRLSLIVFVCYNGSQIQVGNFTFKHYKPVSEWSQEDIDTLHEKGGKIVGKEITVVNIVPLGEID